MIYAVGTPGQPVRIFVEPMEEATALDQAEPGEVVFAVPDATRGVIAQAVDGWVIDPVPEEPGDDLRAARDLRLAACDWTQLPDAPVADAAAWAAYRQALRDIPETQPEADLSSVVWPIPPSS